LAGEGPSVLKTIVGSAVAAQKELQMLVEQQQEQLLREFSTISNAIERMLEFNSLLPPERMVYAM
jgi:hypothetical protein